MKGSYVGDNNRNMKKTTEFCFGKQKMEIEALFVCFCAAAITTVDHRRSWFLYHQERVEISLRSC
jgi:hypothetical protein